MTRHFRMWQYPAQGVSRSGPPTEIFSISRSALESTRGCSICEIFR